MVNRKEAKQIRVHTYSGYRADERPLHFIFEERKHLVKRVLDQWREPEDDFFRVETEDGGICILKRERREDRWFILRNK